MSNLLDIPNVRGEAIVVLPPYFEALTRRDRRTVQLTARGRWSPL